MSYLGASDIIYSDVIDSFISEILKFESSVIQVLTEKPKAVLFTPLLSKSEWCIINYNAICPILVLSNKSEYRIEKFFFSHNTH